MKTINANTKPLSFEEMQRYIKEELKKLNSKIKTK